MDADEDSVYDVEFRLFVEIYKRELVNKSSIACLISVSVRQSFSS
jgi:hypothetical protein